MVVPTTTRAPRLGPHRFAIEALVASGAIYPAVAARSASLWFFSHRPIRTSTVTSSAT